MRWEADLSIPELGLILEMADFFDTSVDVLLGDEMRDNRVEPSVSRLWEMNSSKDRTGLCIFAHTFYLRGDYLSAKDVLQWGMKCLAGLKRQKGPSQIDGIVSIFHVCLAGIQLRTDSPETAGNTLDKAIALAEKLAKREGSLCENRTENLPVC